MNGETRPATGLYRKALTFYQPGSTNGNRPENEDGINAAERAKIASRIDSILAENRIPVSPQTLAYTPKRRGAFLPLASNIAVLAAFALAGFLIFRLLNHQEASITTGQATILGAENKLIAAMKKDAEQKLRERDQAILDAQQKLASVSQREQQLKAGSESALQARVAELSAEFDRRLSQEKARLASQGLSQAAQARRLNDFEAARRQEMDRQLAAARRQARADLAARQRSLVVLASRFQSDLDSARLAREQLQGDLNNLTPGPQTGSGSSAAAQELARLRKQSQDEQLVLDQILAGYSRVNAALQKDDFAGAQKGLDFLRSYLQDPSVQALPAIQKRRDVELFLIDSLSDLVRSRSSASTPDASIAEAVSQIRSVSDLVAKGDERAGAGDLKGARDAYLQALGVIGPVNHGYLSLEQMRTAREKESEARAMAGLAQANIFYQAGNFLGSIRQYQTAVSLLLKDDTLARQLTGNIMNAGYHVLASDDLASLARFRTEAQRRQAILDQLQQIRNQYAAYASTPYADTRSTSTPYADTRSTSTPYAALRPQSDAPESARSLASLLQAKIVLLQILDSEPVRSQHPELGLQIQRYFSALEQQARSEGRSATLQELSAMLEKLGGNPGTDAALQPSSDPLLALLDRLSQILSE